jgi:short-subunit dehydrogenase
VSRLPRFVFRGRTAVVTGAASGIGEQIAHALARRGTTLVLLDRDTERLRAVASEVRFLNPEVEVGTIVVELADAPALDLVAEGVRATHPRVDLLVNNAGVAMAGLFEQMSLEEFEWLVDVNLRAPVRLTHHLLPALVAAANAHVVNMSSVFGIVAPPGQTAYSTSKFGLRGFSEALRSEVRSHGVGVTTVYPGGIRTAIARNAPSASGVREEDVAAGRAAFEGALRIPPERAAELILRAVERRKARLLIGASARLPDVAARLAPVGHSLAFRPMLVRSSAHGASPSARNTLR